MGKTFSDISLPCVMGILNITPDSFSDGGKFFDERRGTPYNQRLAEEHLSEIIDGGAAIVDIGGESTKPGVTGIDPTIEWRRIEHIVRVASGCNRVAISVDTYHTETAKLALECGANIINDVRGTWHFREMAQLLDGFDAHIVVMHNSRDDENFLTITDPVSAIISEFEKIFDIADGMKFDVARIILDPGIGFGKTVHQNLEIFKEIGKICTKFSNPVVCATSKKSFLKEAIGSDIPMALSTATVATTVSGFFSGCKIFRVHDVAENLTALKLAERLYG